MSGSRSLAADIRQEAATKPNEWVVELVESRLRWGSSPKEVVAELEEMERRGDIGWAPSARTIRSWIATGRIRRPRRPEDPWSLVTGHPDDLALVVPVLPLVAHVPTRMNALSVREAEVIARVRRAAPDLPIAAAATVGVLYAAREQKGRSTAELDLYLAMHTWRWDGESPEEWLWQQRRYIRLAEAAGVRAIGVSFVTPGRITNATTLIATVTYTSGDVTWQQFAHEWRSPEMNETALDSVARRALDEQDEALMLDAARKRKERAHARQHP